MQPKMKAGRNLTMKFSEMPYQRPDIDRIRVQIDEIRGRIEHAASAEEQIAAYSEFEKLYCSAETMLTIAYIRHSIDTRDPFYDGEQNFSDETMPLLEELVQTVNLAMLHSAFRPALEAHYGRLLFTNLEIAVRAFSPEILPLMQEENKLASQYQNLYASAMVDFRGEKLPLPKLGPYKESTDRAARREAYEAEGRFFDEHRKELDELYGKLVRCRNAQARKLGHENYLQLGYDRLGRNCYSIADVAAFRDQIASDLVPIVAGVKKDQRARLGVEHLYFYDDTVLFPDGNARPQGTPDEILAAGRKMYHELSPETAEFIDAMFDADLFDVLSKPGKAPGGYCTSLPDYRLPFIFSNFNGTSGDVDVLTHEAGHAFADFRAYKYNYPRALQSPNMESCECHSMSMEFLTQDYHRYFFGPSTEKYELGHCEDALIFIPYGCMVDEFQHLMYENEDLTPEERNETWLRLERKYRPWIDFDNLPFYGRGSGWQRQLHIYLYPLYYIDYCMAQTVAFQFWILSRHDRADAWTRYLRFVDAGGTKTFRELCEDSGIDVPYEPGCIRRIGSAVSEWISACRL
jgi:M3 family oligoendopeptidase